MLDVLQEGSFKAIDFGETLKTTEDFERVFTNALQEYFEELWFV